MRPLSLLFGILLSGCAVFGQPFGVVSFSVTPLAITQTFNDGGINDAGQIVFNDGAFSYLLNPGGTVTQIPGEQQAKALTTLLHGINSAGQTVGAAGSHAVFRSDEGYYSDLNGSSAFGINLEGQIVGITDAAESSAFVTAGINASYQTFKCPSSATRSQAMGINGLGQVVGSCTTTNIPVTGFNQSAFFRDTDGTVTILSLPSSYAEARGINDAGQIVGSFRTNQGSGPGPQQGFFRNTDGTVTTFGLGSAFYAINNGGQILGIGYYAPGKYGPFVATIIPSNQGIISHIAAGGGWSTAITLINTSAAPVPATVAFHNDDGSPLTQQFTTAPQTTSQTTAASSVSATISPNATLVVSLGDPAAPLAVGWADVISSGSLNGYAIFRTSSPNSPVSEGTVPLQSHLSSIVTLPFDNTAGFTMGVALANVASGSASVTATMWDASGNSLGTQTITIAGSGHTSFDLSSQLPPTAGKRGIVRFESAAGGIAGLGLRFSPFGTFTSVPAF